MTNKDLTLYEKVNNITGQGVERREGPAGNKIKSENQIDTVNDNKYMLNFEQYCLFSTAGLLFRFQKNNLMFIQGLEGFFSLLPLKFSHH